ncbi:DUF4389 domain-containing protein [Sphaerisporangium sp. TRM90804]|uniref:DUF4389 domain-containing protein n=1 Tax=Sphaerisporangium sp. TRM90804 TaxID=3031113 RepID=UPI0024473AEB|nr:DUF4389 domain-containing protein [Sphaerisporangium sp. TRM90804]MDH2426355.1 DUF4389 domain-containing protein [Sphaerisporangium sp. TRM90804]
MNRYGVQVRSSGSSPAGRWLWLVKWLLLIPHYLILLVLWAAFAVLTLIAYVAVLVTGRYPPAIFVFNVGVLRWSWRVGFYGYQVLGTDRYPPFTLAEVPDYPAGLLIDGPPRPPRWLPLVAWLFAIPHILILSVLTATGGWRLLGDDADASVASFSLVGVGVTIVAISLAVRGRAPRGLRDLLVGVARWSLRVVAYVALLTAQYPPFRLDQGDTESPVDQTGSSDPSDSSDSRPAARRPAPAPAAGAGVAGLVIALTSGVLLLPAAAGILIGGAGVLALAANRDAAGYVTSPALRIDSPTGAVTAEDLRIHTGDVWSRALVDYGRVRITASNPSTPLFVGIAPQADVDRWLAGTARDRLAGGSLSGGVRLDRTTDPIRDVTAPAAQSFWLASASGTGDVVLDWQVADGRFAVVLANATGAPGVRATGRIATRIPDPTGLGFGLLGGAIPLAVLALALTYLGAAGLGRRHGPPSADVTDADAPGGPGPVDVRLPVEAASGPDR